MKVSVIVPTYSMERYPDFSECVDSVLNQTYDDVECVIIVDGNEEVYERAVKDYGHRDDTIIYLSAEDAGPLSRGNMGVIQANGDIVASTDDDAVPRTDWVERLVEAYEQKGAIAVGGKMVPEWVAGKPDFLPEEFYWLIGATHKGFKEEAGEVRNTFGANISWKRDIFLKLGGFKIAGMGPSELQGRETELCARMQDEYGKGIWYEPRAIVAHKVYEYRTDKVWLAKRAFWQGVSKRGMKKYVPKASGNESEFLSKLLRSSIPKRSVKSLTSLRQAKQLAALLILTALVGLGYVYGFVKYH